MTIARKDQISLDATPYYHCISHCVRRAFLCGTDSFSGVNYDHRKQWIVDWMKFLSAVFAINIAAYAVMSNHYHMVLHVDETKAQGWSEDEVTKRWKKLFGKTNASSKPKPGQKTKLDETLDVSLWRSRLMDISWLAV